MSSFFRWCKNYFDNKPIICRRVLVWLNENIIQTFRIYYFSCINNSLWKYYSLMLTFNQKNYLIIEKIFNFILFSWRHVIEKESTSFLLFDFEGWHILYLVNLHHQENCVEKYGGEKMTLFALYEFYVPFLFYWCQDIRR